MGWREVHEAKKKRGSFAVGVDGPHGIAKRAKVWLLKVKQGAVQMELKRVGIGRLEASGRKARFFFL